MRKLTAFVKSNRKDHLLLQGNSSANPIYYFALLSKELM